MLAAAAASAEVRAPGRRRSRARPHQQFGAHCIAENDNAGLSWAATFRLGPGRKELLLRVLKVAESSAVKWASIRNAPGEEESKREQATCPVDIAAQIHAAVESACPRRLRRYKPAKTVFIATKVGCPGQHWHQDLTGPNVIVPLGRRDLFVGEEQVRRRWYCGGVGAAVLARRNELSLIHI